MRKKLAAAVALVLCFAFTLCGCGGDKTNYKPKTETRKITEAVNIAEGLENPTGRKLKKQNGNTADFGTAYVIEGTLASGTNAGRRETRVYDYLNGKNVFTVTDTATSVFNVCELNNLSFAIYVYSEPTADEITAGTTDSEHVFTHFAAIYSRYGELIAKKEVKTTDSDNDISPSDLGDVYTFTGSNSKRRKFFRTAENALWEIDGKGEASLIADNIPTYNNVVDYDYKINGNYYVCRTGSVTVYDSAFNIIGHVEYPTYIDAIDGNESFILDDGKVFYQTLALASDTEQNYDLCIVNGDDKLIKLKLRDFIIDPIKGTIQKISCDYMLTQIYNRVTAEEELAAYADGVKNVAFAVKIVDKTVNMSDMEMYELSNDGKFGNSLNLVKYQKSPMTTIDGKYFLAYSATGVISVYDANLKKITSYPESALNNYDTHGQYLYDSNNQIIFDYALNKVYEAKKNDKGEFVEEIDILDVGSYDCRIVIYERAENGDYKFSVLINGEKKLLKEFKSGGDVELVYDSGYAYYGRNQGGQFYCTYVNSTSKYHYYNFDGTELFVSDYKLGGYTVVGGCSLIFSEAHGIYIMLR